MRKTGGFQPLFLKTNTKTNERYCVFLQYPSFFIRLCLNTTASFVLFLIGAFALVAFAIHRARGAGVTAGASSALLILHYSCNNKNYDGEKNCQNSYRAEVFRKKR